MSARPATGAGPLPDVVDEARRLVGVADAQQVPARLLGGTAVALRAGRAALGGDREIKDIDVAVAARHRDQLSELLAAEGYRPHERFNTLRADRRLLFFDDRHARQLDVFVGRFEMCHKLDLAPRLERDAVTLPLAELVLTKLQTVELNPKDLVDLYALFGRFPLGDDDGDRINAAVIAGLCADDWGWHRTVTLNLGRMRERLPAAAPDAASEVIAGRLAALERRLADAPKSRRWRMRARIGERVRWYDAPEEVDE